MEPMDRHIGETRTMNNGMKATIVAYRRTNDIDVRFSNGHTVYHKQYSNFVSGTIGDPAYRIGRRRKMHCGLYCKIIRYRNALDMDVLFENGAERKHVQFAAFENRQIRPVWDGQTGSKRASRIGTSNVMHCGKRATIIEYRNSCDMDIKFEDGTIRERVRYDAFKAGHIKP